MTRADRVLYIYISVMGENGYRTERERERCLVMVAAAAVVFFS